MSEKERISVEAAGETAAVLEKLISEYPEEELRLGPVISKINHGDATEKTLLETREMMRGIISSEERKMLRKRDDILDAVKSLYDISDRFTVRENGKFYDVTDCFPGEFGFYPGRGFYYLRLPKLNIKTGKDGTSRSENMIGRYIKESVIKSLEMYRMGREKHEIFDRFTIVFVHHFRAENSDGFDTDNIEIKKAIDSVNGILIENDTVGRSHIYQITAESDEEFTEMFIIKGHNLSDVILWNLMRLEAEFTL